MPDHRFTDSPQVDEFPTGIHALLDVESRSKQDSDFLPRQNFQKVTASKPGYCQSQVNSWPLTTFHADPLTPLRQRDEQALDDIFNHAQVEEIVADIYIRLQQLCPEPCWDDDLFDFLKGYL